MNDYLVRGRVHAHCYTCNAIISLARPTSRRDSRFTQFLVYEVDYIREIVFFGAERAVLHGE